MTNMNINRLSLVLLTLLFFVYSASSALAETPAEYTDPLTKMEFVFIPAGEFNMGNSSPLSEAREIAETPQHKVSVPAFYMGKYEVTFDKYLKYSKAFWRKTPSDQDMGMGSRPVINITWNQAVAFAKWLSKKSGRKFRLPTEAEWEFAARAGTETAYWWGNNAEDGKANCHGCQAGDYAEKSAPVGSYPPNPWGLYDILGNVYEWTQDDYHADYVGAPTDGSAWVTKGSSKGSNMKINRGGGYQEFPPQLRVTFRDWEYQDSSYESLGFRLVMEAPDGLPIQPVK